MCSKGRAGSSSGLACVAGKAASGLTGDSSRSKPASAAPAKEFKPYVAPETTMAELTVKALVAGALAHAAVNWGPLKRYLTTRGIGQGIVMACAVVLALSKLLLSRLRRGEGARA